MSKTKIIITLTFVILILAAGIFWYLSNNEQWQNTDFGFSIIQPRKQVPLPQAPIPTSLGTARDIVRSENTQETASAPIAPKDPRSEIIYDANGKLDTSKWVEYRSEYGGFSVVAPKYFSSIGFSGKGYDPRRDGEFFHYILIPYDEGGLYGMSIEVIQKMEGTHLDNWINKYVTSGSNKLMGVQKVSLSNYPALSFERQKTTSDMETVGIRYAIYPSGIEYNSGLAGATYAGFRFFVVDANDRYILIYHTLSINTQELLNSISGLGPLTPKFFDNKRLTDVYQSILDSFRIFPPTKS